MYLTKSFIFPRRYGGLSSRYKRPIVTGYLPFKITIVMKNPSELGSPNRLALESLLEAGMPSCSELHNLGGRKAEGAGPWENHQQRKGVTSTHQ
jgi:hypothetical protein